MRRFVAYFEEKFRFATNKYIQDIKHTLIFHSPGLPRPFSPQIYASFNFF